MTPDIPQAALNAAAEGIHAHRCRHEHFGCPGPSDADREYAIAALSRAEQVWPHDPAKRLQVVPSDA